MLRIYGHLKILGHARFPRIPLVVYPLVKSMMIL